MSSEKLKLVFITGPNRSGSTLLDVLLEQVEGYFSVGELVNLWGLRHDDRRLCSCGQPFAECALWRAVVADTFGTEGPIDPAIVRQLRRAARIRHLPQALTPFKTASYRAAFDAYAHHLTALYTAVRRHSESRVIIDSSKAPVHGLFLSAMPNIDLYVIHLVRDSRAVAYSWQRTRRKPDFHWTEAYMPRQAPTTAAWRWNLANALSHVLRHTAAHFLRLRYEDLAAHPRASLEQVMAFLDEPTDRLDFLEDTSFSIHAGHALSGNPWRFRSGEKLDIRMDAEWKEKMPPRQKLWVLALTWPFLLRYSYLR